jgi:DNA-directed RNA polymerase specialized sigma subunit
MKIIDNDAFLEAWNNTANIDIIEKVASKYAMYIPLNELQRCKMIGLWEAMRTFQENRGTKFTTHLANRVKWECLNAISEIIKENNQNISTLPSGVADQPLQLPELDEDSQVLLCQRFVENKTLRELGAIFNCSHETIRRKIKKIIIELQK